MIQIFQQQIEELLHSHQSLQGHSVNEAFTPLQLLQRPRHRWFGLLLFAVALPPVIEVYCQRGDFSLDLQDAIEAVRDHAVVALQAGHYRGRSSQLISRGVEGHVKVELLWKKNKCWWAKNTLFISTLLFLYRLDLSQSCREFSACTCSKTFFPNVSKYKRVCA